MRSRDVVERRAQRQLIRRYEPSWLMRTGTRAALPALGLLEQQRRPVRLADAVGDLGHLELRVDLRAHAGELTLAFQQADEVHAGPRSPPGDGVELDAAAAARVVARCQTVAAARSGRGRHVGGRRVGSPPRRRRTGRRRSRPAPRAARRAPPSGTPTGRRRRRTARRFCAGTSRRPSGARAGRRPRRRRARRYRAGRARRSVAGEQPGSRSSARERQGAALAVVQQVALVDELDVAWRRPRRRPRRAPRTARPQRGSGAAAGAGPKASPAATSAAATPAHEVHGQTFSLSR